MLIATLKLEAKALKAFKEDPETESETEDESTPLPRQMQNEGGAKDIELSSRIS